MQPKPSLRSSLHTLFRLQSNSSTTPPSNAWRNTRTWDFRPPRTLLLIEVDGQSAVVEEDAAKVAGLCKSAQMRRTKVASHEAEAIRLKTARRAAFSALARVKPTTILEDVTVPEVKLLRCSNGSMPSQKA